MGLPVAIVVGGTPGLLHCSAAPGGRPPFDPPPAAGLRIEVEAVDMEDAYVRFVLHDRFGFAWLFVDLHRAVEPGRIVAIAAAGGGCRARRGEHQESQTGDEGQDSGCLAHLLMPPVLDLRGPMRGDCFAQEAGHAPTHGGRVTRSIRAMPKSVTRWHQLDDSKRVVVLFRVRVRFIASHSDVLACDRGRNGQARAGSRNSGGACLPTGR